MVGTSAGRTRSQAGPNAGLMGISRNACNKASARGTTLCAPLRSGSSQNPASSSVLPARHVFVAARNQVQVLLHHDVRKGPRIEFEQQHLPAYRLDFGVQGMLSQQLPVSTGACGHDARLCTETALRRRQLRDPPRSLGRSVLPRTARTIPGRSCSTLARMAWSHCEIAST